MERLIQYAHAEDEVRVAYWRLGCGRPLLCFAGGPWNRIDIWEVPECRAWYEELAKDRTLIRYDVCGTGLSDREVSDFSLDAYLRDLDAVVDEVGLDQFGLFAAGDVGPVAITYADRQRWTTHAPPSLAFGRAKRDGLPRCCQECPVLAVCNGRVDPKAALRQPRTARRAWGPVLAAGGEY